MADSNGERKQVGNLPWLAPAMVNPMMTGLADMSCSILEGFATAQKDWADFFQRRIREDVAASRALMNCQSLPDVYQIYSKYLQVAYEQYRAQSEQIVQRGASMTQYLAETAEAKTKEAIQTRH
jgi:Phasin protein